MAEFTLEECRHVVEEILMYPPCPANPDPIGKIAQMLVGAEERGRMHGRAEWLNTPEGQAAVIAHHHPDGAQQEAFARVIREAEARGAARERQRCLRIAEAQVVLHRQLGLGQAATMASLIGGLIKYPVEEEPAAKGGKIDG